MNFSSEKLETNNTLKYIRDFYSCVSDFKKGYRLRINIVKDEKGDMVTESHSILARWRNHFFQLLKEHGDNDVRQTGLYTAEPLVPDHFEIAMAIEKLKRQNHQVIVKSQQS
jgi:hypothetical protein